MQILSDILMRLIDILAISGPYVLLGFVIAGVLHIFLPESLFGRLFGSRGLRPLLRAIGLGSLIPVCSCGVIPIGLGAYRAGAGTGTVLAFMTAAPTLSPAAVLLSLKLLGAPLTIWQVLFVLFGSLLMGLAGNRWLGHRSPSHRGGSQQPPAPAPATGGMTLLPVLDQAAAEPELPSCCQSHAVPAPSVKQVAEQVSCCGDHAHSATEGTPRTLTGSGKELARWLTWDFGPGVCFDMFIGLLFAATVLTLVPDSLIVQFTGSRTIGSLLLVILAAIPVYTCSMAAIPMIFGFLAAGMSPGAAVAFLIAGPATNFGEMNAIRGHIGWRTALYYFVSLLTLAVVAGLFVDHAVHLPTPPLLEQVGEHSHQHHQHVPPGATGPSYTALEWTSLIILLSLLLIETGKRMRRLVTRFRWSAKRTSPQESRGRQGAAATTKRETVPASPTSRP